MESIIRRFNEERQKYRGTKKSLELELRFGKIPREFFERIYFELTSKPHIYSDVKIECTLNAFAENKIRRYTFELGKPTKIEHVYKKQLDRARITRLDSGAVNIVLSEEGSSPEFTVPNDAPLRFKVRFSARAGAWRYDLTAVHETSLDKVENPARLKKDLLHNYKPDTFLTQLPHELITFYEFEIEYIGGSAGDVSTNLSVDDVPIFDFLEQIAPEYFREKLRRDSYQKVLSFYKHRFVPFKNFVNRAISLDNKTYNKIFPIPGYFVTAKADGQRALLILDGDEIIMVTNNQAFSWPSRVENKFTVADCEYVADRLPPTIYIFDVLVYEGDKISDRAFSARIEYCSRVADAATLAAKDAGDTAKDAGDATKNTIPVFRAKDYLQIPPNPTRADLRKIFTEIRDKKYDFETDGIILTEPDNTYFSTKNYKWKPVEKLTIDFLAKKCPKELLGKGVFQRPAKGELYILFVGCSAETMRANNLRRITNYDLFFSKNTYTPDYFPMHFTPSLYPLAYLYEHNVDAGGTAKDIDGRVVELGCELPIAENAPLNWRFHRVRDERNDFGNDFKVAEFTFMGYIDPMHFENLIEPKISYFDHISPPKYKAANQFRRFIAARELERFRGTKWIIDAGSGRGADLGRYRELAVENVLFIDVDATAISELIFRKHTSLKTKAKVISASSATTAPLTIHTLVADLKSPVEKLVANVLRYGAVPGNVDAIVSNFAFHYLCDTLKNMQNALKFSSRMLKPGGHLLIITMDGDEILSRFDAAGAGKKKPAPIEFEEDGVVKYRVELKRRTAAGGEISVLLPFSAEMREEPLCRFSVVEREAKKHKLQMVEKKSLDKYLPEMKKSYPEITKKLTIADIEYARLQVCALFVKE